MIIVFFAGSFLFSILLTDISSYSDANVFGSKDKSQSLQISQQETSTYEDNFKSMEQWKNDAGDLSLQGREITG